MAADLRLSVPQRTTSAARRLSRRMNYDRRNENHPIQQVSRRASRRPAEGEERKDGEEGVDKEGKDVGLHGGAEGQTEANGGGDEKVKERGGGENGGDRTASGSARHSGTVAAPNSDPATAGPSCNFPYMDRKAAQIPSKYDGKDDIESWISSMRSYSDVLGTLPVTQSSVLGTNVEPAVRGFLEIQAKIPSEVCNLLNRFPEVLLEPHGVPMRPVRHKIELIEGSTPPKGCVYRMGSRDLEELRRQIDDMIGKGWIKPSESEFGAPVLFVPKKGGKLRMCIDYRGLNRITRKNAYPLPRIDELLDVASGCKVFSKIDLKSGYHQIEVDPADQHTTAFKTRDGLYEFTAMPFGLTNAPATFQSLMDKVFHNQINRFVVVYLDDILIFSKSMEEHVRHLDEVLQILKDAQLHLNLEKSEFGRDSVIYLGHRLSAAGLEPEATKVEVIRNWPQRANVRELRSFLGLAPYYPKFVPKFFIIARPLSKLTSKNVSYTWDGECTTAFQALKEALIGWDLVKLGAQDLPGGSGGKKTTGRKRFPGSNHFAAYDLLEDDEETFTEDPSLDDDQEQGCEASCSSSAHESEYVNDDESMNAF
ncbi:hypothetical protein CBR_g2705 [Chara braunii]|uniref:Reverse transcriptase domain-containing protein n=1 Tax=Chara braunii TaxID=69332 RepID=A0A388KDM0_CHABU|nr:hypothetical protein CBR_g2705 [Chara braunii]|eukprot:GBG68154.1 hypothetical protein CBR_g2705 [Chara braunii]